MDLKRIRQTWDLLRIFKNCLKETSQDTKAESLKQQTRRETTQVRDYLKCHNKLRPEVESIPPSSPPRARLEKFKIKDLQSGPQCKMQRLLTWRKMITMMRRMNLPGIAAQKLISTRRVTKWSTKLLSPPTIQLKLQ